MLNTNHFQQMVKLGITSANEPLLTFDRYFHPVQNVSFFHRVGFDDLDSELASIIPTIVSREIFIWKYWGRRSRRGGRIERLNLNRRRWRSGKCIWNPQKAVMIVIIVHELSSWPWVTIQHIRSLGLHATSRVILQCGRRWRWFTINARALKRIEIVKGLHWQLYGWRQNVTSQQ